MGAIRTLDHIVGQARRSEAELKREVTEQARERRVRERVNAENYLRAGALNCTRTPSGPVTKTEFPDFSALAPGTARSIAARAASGEKFSTAIAKWSIGLIRPVPVCMAMKLPAVPTGMLA